MSNIKKKKWIKKKIKIVILVDDIDFAGIISSCWMFIDNRGRMISSQPYFE